MARCDFPTPGGPWISKASPLATQRHAAKPRTCLASSEGSADQLPRYAVVVGVDVHAGAVLHRRVNSRNWRNGGRPLNGRRAAASSRTNRAIGAAPVVPCIRTWSQARFLVDVVYHSLIQIQLGGAVRDVGNRETLDPRTVRAHLWHHSMATPA
jgi:hypothetical protein